ncbi:uracil-DNA glycosylase [Paenibacillus crassostreae]|uniref:Uracil-DNA glycosylase n=1 Tax=Paenibacillus crassostreae TaxID=1763538 RepID=A0A167B4L9_9BACL|nr:uracil-DNA glycosylase [Paenibacillus crassostreae]AOZ93173.1 uracil-DNA glycosylase [Paenibacillus crassostreae]OAB71736.1 uracil-DNA glycosylase [Paenibacillus crassostreae]
MNENQRINCMKCQHFYVTWDRQFPKGCRAYEFKTAIMPSHAVFASSGKACMSFEQKGNPRS